MSEAASVPQAEEGAAFEVLFVEGCGGKRGGPLLGYWNTSFENVEPVRKFSWHQGQSSFAGVWWWATSGEHIGYESWLERDHVMALDFDPDVVGLSSQPFRLSWVTSGKVRRHVPDFFARLADGTGMVIDVRADGRISPEDAQTFAATERACQQVGWTYRRVGEFDRVRVANLRWLAGYRHPRYRQAEAIADLLEAFAAPVPLMIGVSQVGDPLRLLPALFHLLWSQRLVTDLTSALLSAASVLVRSEEEMS
ncbi:TnsA-like heteromeric transposase endonuclease subunit [Nonomuraea sp. H19]|uniref:TnsA-like heteromeric transposase endonuclease subunit n=1 Tax=Nonomuraea sp. H19 TaxID=3452206 RepID=UPI003F8A70DF